MLEQKYPSLKEKKLLHNVTLTAHFNPGIWHLSKTKMKRDETPVFLMDIYGIFHEDFKTVFLFRASWRRKSQLGTEDIHFEGYSEAPKKVKISTSS